MCYWSNLILPLLGFDLKFGPLGHGNLNGQISVRLTSLCLGLGCFEIEKKITTAMQLIPNQ